MLWNFSLDLLCIRVCWTASCCVGTAYCETSLCTSCVLQSVREPPAVEGQHAVEPFPFFVPPMHRAGVRTAASAWNLQEVTLVLWKNSNRSTSRFSG